MKKFSDFSSEGDVFDGEKVKLATLLDKENLHTAIQNQKVEVSG